MQAQSLTNTLDTSKESDVDMNARRFLDPHILETALPVLQQTALEREVSLSMRESCLVVEAVEERTDRGTGGDVVDSDGFKDNGIMISITKTKCNRERRPT